MNDESSIKAVDLYSPNLGTTSWNDKMRDKYLGENNVAMTNTLNDYELDKAVNINKYMWNKEGMLAAGINPMIATDMLDSVSQSSATSGITENVGVLSDFIEDLLDTIKPSSIKKDMKDVAGILAKVLI